MYEVFEKSIAFLKKSTDVQSFIADILTPTEKIMVSKRLGITVLLAKGYEYRQISRVLKVSFGTINAVLKQQFINGQGYRAVVDKILHDEKMEEIFLEAEKVLGEIIGHPARKTRDQIRYITRKEQIARREI